MAMHWVDYVIMVAFLCTSLAIGVYHAFTGGRQRTTEEFIMADRKQGVLPIMLSLLVSYESALVILGSTAEMYAWGSHMIVVVCTGLPIAILLAERLVIPWLYPLGLTSIYEYFEMRFESKAVRILASVIGITWGLLYMGSAMFAPSVALETATGLPVSIAIPVMAVICTLYTAIGGMRAVIWTDVFQFVVMMAGMLAVLIKGSMLVGGLGSALDICESEGRLQWHNLDPDPTVRSTTWGVLGYTVTWLYLYGFQQAAYQRFTATRSMKQSRMIMLFNIPLVVVLVGMTYIIGILVFAYYSQQACDPLASGQITSPNELLGLFVKKTFEENPGFMGFFLATLYSGALSSVSSSLSGAAANMWEDILKIKLGGLTDYQATLVNKTLVVLFGCLATAVAFLASTLPGPVSQISDAFMGAAGGPLLGMFLLGGISRTTEWIGTLVGGLVSFGACLWICVMGSTVFSRRNTPLPPVSTSHCLALDLADNVTSAIYMIPQEGDTTLSPTPAGHPISGIEHLYAVSFLWYGLIGMVLTLIIGLITSAVVQKVSPTKRPVPAHLLIRWRELYRCTDEKDLIIPQESPGCVPEEMKDLNTDNKIQNELNKNGKINGSHHPTAGDKLLA